MEFSEWHLRKVIKEELEKFTDLKNPTLPQKQQSCEHCYCKIINGQTNNTAANVFVLCCKCKTTKYTGQTYFVTTERFVTTDSGVQAKFW